MASARRRALPRSRQVRLLLGRQAAGQHGVYLQFDGTNEEDNKHRGVGNLFDVKLKAIHNLHNAGVDIVPVITIINGINNEQVGAVVRFALACLTLAPSPRPSPPPPRPPPRSSPRCAASASIATVFCGK